MKYLNTKQSIVETVTEFIKSEDSLMLVLTRDCDIIVKELAQEIFKEYFGAKYTTNCRIDDELCPDFQRIIPGCCPDLNDIPLLISLYKNCGHKILAISSCLREEQIKEIAAQYGTQIPLCYQQNDIECWQSWAKANEIHPLIRSFIQQNGPDMISGYGNLPYYSDNWQSVSSSLINWEKYGDDDDGVYEFDIDSEVELHQLPQEFREYFVGKYNKQA